MRLLGGPGRIVAGLAVIAAAAGVAYGLAWDSGRNAEAELSPARAVELRFAPEPEPAASGRSDEIAARERARVNASHLSFAPDSVVYTKPPDAAASLRRADEAMLLTPTAPANGSAVSSVATAWPDPSAANAPPAAPPVDRNAAFSEGQIASIRERLNLTAEQERYWPPVEAALRSLMWRRPPARGRQAKKEATLDPEGVRKLSAAALALVVHLNADQKREVRTLAFLLGLEKIAEQL